MDNHKKRIKFDNIQGNDRIAAVDIVKLFYEWR